MQKHIAISAKQNEFWIGIFRARRRVERALQLVPNSKPVNFLALLPLFG